MEKIDENVVKNLVRVGTVTDVNNVQHLARVKYKDTNLPSAWLKVLDNRPYIPDYDVPQRTKFEAGGGGYGAYDSHKHDLIIKQWMPKVNDTVLVLYVPVPHGDGYVLGGMK